MMPCLLQFFESPSEGPSEDPSAKHIFHEAEGLGNFNLESGLQISQFGFGCRDSYLLAQILEDALKCFFLFTLFPFHVFND